MLKGLTLLPFWQPRFCAGAFLCGGCRSPESGQRIIRRLTDFQSRSRYVRFVRVGPEDLADFYRKPESSFEDVCWNIDGVTGRHRFADSVTYQAGWCSRLGRIAIVTMDGATLVSPETGKTEVAWKPDGLLKVGGAVSEDFTKTVARGFDPKGRMSFIGAVDLVSGASARYEPAEAPPCSRITFIDQDTAMAYTSEGLLRIAYEPSAGWRFEEIPGQRTRLGLGWGSSEHAYQVGQREL